MSIRRTALLLAALPLSTLVRPVTAQQGAPVMVVPRESQHARASQTIGLTDLSVDYSRPAVKGRKIWGALVPFDSVWRAGANENTVLAVSSPFTIGGIRLPAGRYGVPGHRLGLQPDDRASSGAAPAVTACAACRCFWR